MTGLAIVVYLNQYPFQPRERDYAYAGSFYAFCIWIGLGVLWIFDLVKNYIDKRIAAALATLLSLSVPTIMAVEVWKVLGAVKSEFDKFATVLEAAQNRLNQANSELDKLVGTRTRQIQRTLKNVETLPDESILAALPEEN